MTKKLLALFIILLLLASLIETKKKAKTPPKNDKKKHNKHQESVPHYLTPDTKEFWLNALLATCIITIIKSYRWLEGFAQA